MRLQPRRSPLLFLIVAAAAQVVRWPYLSLSVVVHAALLALLYYVGSYQPELRRQEAEVTSSLRATSRASAAKRLQDLQTIKQLLERSAERASAEPQPSPAAAAPPQTPEQMVAQARELAEAIDTIDQEIRAEELARLTAAREPPAGDSAAGEVAALESAERSAPAGPRPLAAEANPDLADSGKPGAGQAGGSTPAPVSLETAASEIAALEAKARATLARRLQRLEAKANGVQVEVGGHGPARESAGGSPAAPPREGRGPDTSVRAEIADFIGAGDRIESTTPSTKYDGSNYFDPGQSRIPRVDATNLVLGHGRMLGAGGQYANRVYLDSWYLIGPFPGRHGAGMFDNPAYPPEKAVLLDAVYYGKDKRVLEWRYVSTQGYPLVPPDMVEDSVYYGYTEVFLDQASDLTAWIGADDDVQIDLNGRRVWDGGNVNKLSYFDTIYNTGTTHLRDYNRTEGKRVLHFEKGRNTIFFKLSNGPNSAFLSLVLTR